MSIKEEAYNLTKEFIETAQMKEKQLLVIGCSTSEVAGEAVGTFSNPELGKEIFEGINSAAAEYGIYIAAQCCEHLNRALVIEKEASVAFGYEEVTVVPKPKAGGSFATAAYAAFKEPVVVEHVKAHGGIDIGDTLVGMHLRDVAVPVRLSVKCVGNARVVCARTRPKYIGGERACYE